MSPRVTLVLAVVALALGAFIVFYERHTVGTSEIARREGRLLEIFDRSRVRRVELEYEGRSIVLSRGEGEDAELRLETPIQTHADDDAVEALLGALDWAVPYRTIDGASAEDRARFGLDEPFASVTITVGDKPIRLVVGKEAPGAEGRYAAGARADRVFVVSADVVEALSHGVDHFRGKRLFPEGFVRVARVEREGEGGAFVLVDDGGSLRLDAPMSMSANLSRVDALLRGMEALSATRFIGEGEVDASLLEPQRIRLEAQADGARHELRVFGACPDAPGMALARVEGGPVVCIEEASLDPLAIPAEDLRDMRLASARDFDVERLELSFGDRRIEISLLDDAKFELFERGESVARGEADESAFTDWLRAMRRTIARDAQPLAERDRARYGLERPRGVLRAVERGPLKRTTVLHIGSSTVTSLYARREGDDVLLEFPEDAVELLRPAAYRVRGRELLDAELHQVQSIHLTAAGDERLEVDPAKRTELAARLASLEAVRYDADAAEPRHGFANPRAQIEFELSPDHHHGHAHGPDQDEKARHRLILGGDAEDGVFARLDEDGAVFVVAHALLEAAMQAR
jgi:hypothetical protein